MPYVVFALKWRPNNFDEIVGQNHIVTTLKSAIEKNRLAHAYLFAGPRGVGKTSTARIFAKALNCKEGPTAHPCGSCPSCVEIGRGSSLDVIEIDGASNRGIDEIRTLRENVKFAPVQGRYKVYIIDEVHQITPDGFNALLKTLEEPPSFVKFIFATTHPHKVIPTILSRCQRLDFRRIATRETIAQLERIVASENITVDTDVLFAIAKASDGSLRDAESILDQLASFSKDTISLKDIISVLGLVEQEALFRLTDEIVKKDPLAALKVLNAIIDEGKDMNVFLDNLIEHFRNLMIARITLADAHLIDLPQDICDRLFKQAQEFTLEEIFAAFNILVNAQEMAKRLESIRIPLEVSLVKLALAKKTANSNTSSPPLAQEKKTVPAKEMPSLDSSGDISQRNNITSAAGGTLPEEKEIKLSSGKTAQAVSLDKVKGVWQHLIESLGKVKMYAAAYLNEGSLKKIENNVLTVAFPRDCSLHKESLEKKENKALVEKLAAELFNASIKFNFILSDEEVKKDENPVLRTALETFNGRVIKEE